VNAPGPISYLMGLPKFGRGVGLHRMLWLAEKARSGLPPVDLDAIKVTGSNGKGSVCALLASVLGALGARPGLYTSPHLVHFHERLVLEGRPTPDGGLAETVAWFAGVREAYEAETGDAIGAFEAFTAVALRFYARHGTRTLVAEAGIG